MGWDEKIACAINALVGAFLGFAIYMFGLGGWRYVFTGRASQSWNGGWTLILCVGIGALVGYLSYQTRLKQMDLPREGIYEGHAGGELLVRRLGIIAMAVVAIYFLWQLAKGI